MSSIAERWAAVCARVAAAARRAKRPSAEVAVVAVSKRHPAEAIAEAADAGVRIVGESYAQELVAKRPQVQRPELAWHFIGKLQRNKVKQVVGTVALVHAVDSERLLQEIDKRACDLGIVQDVLVAVSLAGEEQKSGVSERELPDLLELASSLASVRVQGLMTMPPLAEAPEDSRPYFARLRELRDRVATGAHPLATLSMGTTDDFEVAVEEGATLVRIGTAIFGPRGK